MLSDDDLAIVKRDEDVPGLAIALDAEALANALRVQLPESGIEAVKLDYVHYKPHTNCLVACRLQTPDGEHMAYAKAYGPDAGIKLEKTRTLRDLTSPLGPGTLIMEAANIGCYFFPVDHRLKGLGRLANPEARDNLLRRMLGKPAEFSGATLQHLRYKPERRFVACVKTSGEPRLLLKFFTPGRYRAAKSAALALSSHSVKGIDRKARFSDRHKVMGLEWLPGRPLSHVLLAPDAPEHEAADAVEKAGSVLAELHSITPPELKKVERADEIARLNAQADTLWHLCAALGKRAEELVHNIIPYLEKIPKDTAVLHGDFYDKQVLQSGGAPVILDLDEACVGHPAIDLGLFIAHLERHRLNDRLTSRETETFMDAIVRGYQLVRPAPSDTSIRLYTVIGLLHLAAEPFRYRESNWRDQMEKHLTHVERLFTSAFPVTPTRHPGAASERPAGSNAE